MKQKILMLVMLLFTASCALSQTKMDKFLGNLNGAVQIFERYESMYNRVKRMNPKQISPDGTVRMYKYKDLRSLTWTTLQIEKQGPYLYVYQIDNGQYKLLGKHAMTVNQSKVYGTYIRRGDYLLYHKVTIVCMDRKGYVYLKRDTQTIESYTFEIKNY